VLEKETIKILVSSRTEGYSAIDEAEEEVGNGRPESDENICLPNVAMTRL
jgi:hypothetical protein